MPKRRSKDSSISQEDAQGLMQMLLNITPGIGDALSVKDFIDNPTLAQGLFSLASVIPGVPRVRAPRDWQDVALHKSGKSMQKPDMPKKFLDQHGFKELEPGGKPAPDTYRYTDEGKLQTFSSVIDSQGRPKLSVKTFDETTSLKTLRNWMGY